MGWFTNNDVQSPAGAVGGRFQPKGGSVRAVILGAALLAPMHAYAVESPKGMMDVTGMQSLSEEELRRVAAQGLADRILQRISLYASNGLGIEVLGDMASLLNPANAFVGLIDAETTFRDAVFNPTNPSMLVDKNGSILLRLGPPVGKVRVRHAEIRGSRGTSYGSVTVRDIDFNRTTIRITKR